MSVEIEEVTSATRLLKLVLPSDEVGNEINDVARKLTKTVSVPGFRKGRVPVDVVKRRFADRIRNDAITALVEVRVKDVLTERGISPIRQPKIEGYSVDDVSNDHQITLSYEVMPEVDDPSLVGEKITKPILNLSESDVDKVIKIWQKQFQLWEPADRPVAPNDKVLTRLAPMKDGSPLWERPQEIDLQIDEDEELSEVKQACIGQSKGDKFTVKSVFDTPPSTDDSNEKQTEPERQEIEYSIEILKVEQPKVGEFNEVIEKKLGVNRLDHEEFRTRAEKEIMKECEQQREQFMKMHALMLLLKRNPFTPPESIVGSQLVKYLQANGFSEEQIAQEIKRQFESPVVRMFHARAMADLKTAMILDKVQADRRITIEDSEVDAYIESSYGDGAQALANLNDPEVDLDMFNHIKQSQAMEYRQHKLINTVLEDAEIEEVNMSLDEFDAWVDSIKNPPVEPGEQFEETADKTVESDSQETAQDMSVIVDALGNPIDKSKSN